MDPMNRKNAVVLRVVMSAEEGEGKGRGTRINSAKSLRRDRKRRDRESRDWERTNEEVEDEERSRLLAKTSHLGKGRRGTGSVTILERRKKEMCSRSS